MKIGGTYTSVVKNRIVILWINLNFEFNLCYQQQNKQSNSDQYTNFCTWCLKCSAILY
jgi:hypothetical protein